MTEPILQFGWRTCFTAAALAEHPESAAQEVAESPTETANEAANGDLQVLARLEKQAVAKKADKAI